MVISYSGPTSHDLAVMTTALTLLRIIANRCIYALYLARSLATLISICGLSAPRPRTAPFTTPASHPYVARPIRAGPTADIETIPRYYQLRATRYRLDIIIKGNSSSEENRQSVYRISLKLNIRGAA